MKTDLWEVQISTLGVTLEASFGILRFHAPEYSNANGHSATLKGGMNRMKSVLESFGLSVFILGTIVSSGGCGRDQSPDTAFILEDGQPLEGWRGEKTAELKTVLQQQNKNLKTWLEAMEEADEANEVATALSELANNMHDLGSGMTPAMKERFSIVIGMQDPPEDIRREVNTYRQLFGQMSSLMWGGLPFADDPGVRQARAEFEEAVRR